MSKIFGMWVVTVFRRKLLPLPSRVKRSWFHEMATNVTALYMGADKSLARPGRKQATATKPAEWVILRDDSLALWKIINEDDAVLIPKNRGENFSSGFLHSVGLRTYQHPDRCQDVYGNISYHTFVTIFQQRQTGSVLRSGKFSTDGINSSPRQFLHHTYFPHHPSVKPNNKLSTQRERRNNR
jgi:hypothetical protein